MPKPRNNKAVKQAARYEGLNRWVIDIRVDVAIDFDLLVVACLHEANPDARDRRPATRQVALDRAKRFIVKHGTSGVQELVHASRSVELYLMQCHIAEMWPELKVKSDDCAIALCECGHLQSSHVRGLNACDRCACEQIKVVHEKAEIMEVIRRHALTNQS